MRLNRTRHNNDSKLAVILGKGSMREVWIFFRGYELNVPGVQGNRLARYKVKDLEETAK